MKEVILQRIRKKNYISFNRESISIIKSTHNTGSLPSVIKSNISLEVIHFFLFFFPAIFVLYSKWPKGFTLDALVIGDLQAWYLSKE